MSTTSTQVRGKKGKNGVSAWVWTLGSFLFFLLIALWQFHSLFGPEDGWDTSYLGMGELEGWLWRYWWVKQLLEGVWLTNAPLSYALWVTAVAGSYPETGNVFDLIVLSWPLEALFGSPLYYNMKCLLVVACNGWAGWMLGRKVLSTRVGAAVCGLVMGISPYVLSEIANGRIRQAIIFPVIFYILSLVELWRRPRLWSAVCAGIWAGISAAVYLYYGMVCALFTFIYVLWCALSSCEGKINRRRLLFGFLGLILAVMAVLPTGGSYLERSLQGQELPEFIWQRDFLTLDELTNPNQDRVLEQNDPLLNSMQRFRSDSMPWQYPFMPRYERCFPWLFSLLFLLALPLAFWRPGVAEADDGEPDGGSSRRLLTPLRLAPWLLGALFFYMLTLGPYLKSSATGLYLASSEGGIATPYVWLFKYLPAFSRLFSPVRMEAGMIACAGVLAGACFEHCLTLLRFPRSLRWVAVGVLTVLSLHGLLVCKAVPVAASSIYVPEFYYRLADMPDCTIVELPFRTGDSLQYFQTVHEKKLLLGWSDGAVPPGYPKGSKAELYTRVFEGLPSNTFLQFLEGLNAHPEAPKTFEYTDYRYFWETAGVKYVIVHERGCYQIEPQKGGEHYEAMLAVLENLFGDPVDGSEERVYERGTMRSYRMSVFAIDEGIQEDVTQD